MSTNAILIDDTTKAIRATVNAKAGKKGFNLKGIDRANSIAFAILADAVEEAGKPELAKVLRDISEFLPVFAQHRSAFYSYNKGHEITAATWGTDRNKFIALDFGDLDTTSASGCFLVEKETGFVWSIKGYGKKNRVVAASVAELTAIYRDNLQQRAERLDRMEKRKAERLATGAPETDEDRAERMTWGD